jgi:esterase/lipase superfamily enzyme
MVMVFFGTNRDMTGTPGEIDFGGGFNPHGPGGLRFGWADVPESCFDDDAKLGDIRIEVLPEQLEPTPDGMRALGSRVAFEEVRRKMAKHERDTVVFIHGYGNTFRNALRHAALLKVLYNAVPFDMFLFSWPSDGTMVPWMSYHGDRVDAKASGPAIARAFLKLVDFLADIRKKTEQAEWCEQRIHLMAHSMGNYALRHAVQGIRSELGDDPPRLFDNVFLFAADEDDDAFEHDHKLRLLPRLARAVNVYYNPKDEALAISDKTKGNPDRLGSDGPRLVDDLPRKLTLLDCRDVASTDARDKFGHDYHRYVPRVIGDVNGVLSALPPEQMTWRNFVPDARAFRLRK